MRKIGKGKEAKIKRMDMKKKQRNGKRDTETTKCDNVERNDIKRRRNGEKAAAISAN